jgi:hypothetical protein
MPTLLKPADFRPENSAETLVTIILSYMNNEIVLSKNAVPPDFVAFAESGGCKLDVRKQLAGDSQFADWVITPSFVKNWNIESGDVVRDKDRILNHGMNINVINDFEGLAEVDYFDSKGVNRQAWVLKSGLELVHKHGGGFKNEGEA